MKISIDWLNTCLDRPVGPDDVDRALTDQGLPIESRLPLDHGNGDEMLDVEVTSNRADCLSHLGLAREVAAGTGRGTVEPDCDLTGSPLLDTNAAAVAAVVNQTPGLCPLYTARVIRGVKVGPSPDWLAQRLVSVGVRSVNNVVDVTNFVLLELGQPLHAFDLATLAGQRVVIRHAQKGESIVAIDGSAYELDGQVLVVADAHKPVAIAGVMGGRDTAVTQLTTDVLLESALFDSLSVRQTSRSLKLASDSSYRFERGVDPLGVDTASRRAAKLICQVTGGRLARGVIRVGEHQPPSRTVVMRMTRCNEILGLKLEPRRVTELLDRLGFEPTFDAGSDRVTCAVPPRRADVCREIDLIEETVRLHGFDAVPVNKKIHMVARPVQPVVLARRKLSEVLVAYGYDEAVTFGFVRTQWGQPFVPAGHEPVLINDAQRSADPMLRPSILPSLLACRKSNQDAGNTGVHLFECAASWTRHNGQVAEHNRLAMLSDAGDAQHSLRHLRSAIGALAHRLAGCGDLALIPETQPCFSTAGRVELAGQKLGHVGLIAPGCLRLFQLQTPVVAAELDLDALLNAYPPQRAVGPMPKFPGIGRDLSVIVDEPVSWQQVRQRVFAASPAMLEELLFVGVYRGKPIPSGKKSVSFRLLFRDPAATLRHEQVDPQVAAVVQQIQKHLGAQLRN